MWFRLINFDYSWMVPRQLRARHQSTRHPRVNAAATSPPERWVWQPRSTWRRSTIWIVPRLTRLTLFALPNPRQRNHRRQSQPVRQRAWWPCWLVLFSDRHFKFSAVTLSFDVSLFCFSHLYNANYLPHTYLPPNPLLIVVRHIFDTSWHFFILIAPKLKNCNYCRYYTILSALKVGHCVGHNSIVGSWSSEPVVWVMTCDELE